MGYILPDKNPVNVSNEESAKNKWGAKADNPKTCTSFDNAADAYLNGLVDGVGYEFSEDDPYTGIDLDKCRDKDTGIINAWAQREIERFNSYTEISVSGTGIHIIVRSSLKLERHRTIFIDENGEEHKLEIYEAGRYFALTGNLLDGTPGTIEERSEQVQQFMDTYFPPKEERSDPINPDGSSVDGMDDQAILAIVNRAKNAAKFKKLYYEGDTSEYYDDDSVADQALCGILAFYCIGSDHEEQLNRLFKGSALYREKWDREDYSKRTIKNAFSKIREFYKPKKTMDYQGKERRHDLPMVVVGNGQLRDSIDDSLAALLKSQESSPTIFVQSGRIVRVTRNEKGTPVILQMGVPEIKGLLTRSADFFKVVGSGDEATLKPVSPPNEVAEGILAMQTGWPLPPLQGIVETPTIRPDGTILDKPGYDEQTYLYYMPGPGMEECGVPEQPTRSDVDQAVAVIEDIIADFPFKTQADHANAYGPLLTHFMRPAISGCVPMATVDATKPGTGKGLYAGVVSDVTTGRPANIMTAPEHEEEWRKQLTSVLLEGQSIILFDNITDKLQSPSLDAVLTAREWQTRMLGSNSIIRVVNNATWIATGNNIQLGSDLARRCYRIRLDPHVSRPWEREGFRHEDLEDWVCKNRARIVSALLTIIRAWYNDGCPIDKSIKAMGTFTDWKKKIGSILTYCNISGFMTNAADLYNEMDADSQEWELFLMAWHDKYQDRWMPLETVAQNLIDDLDMEGRIRPDTFASMLPGTLADLLKNRAGSFKIRLGRRLSEKKDACFGDDNIHLEVSLDKHKKTNLWRVAMEPLPFAGSGPEFCGESQKKESEDKSDFEPHREPSHDGCESDLRGDAGTGSILHAGEKQKPLLETVF